MKAFAFLSPFIPTLFHMQISFPIAKLQDFLGCVLRWSGLEFCLNSEITFLGGVGKSANKALLMYPTEQWCHSGLS